MRFCARTSGLFWRRFSAPLSPGQIFIPAWHLGAIAYQLERIRCGGIKRLIINMPPRSLKSVTASVAFPAYVLGHDPTRRIICVSYSGDLARKHANDFRAVLQAPWYQTLFQRTRIGQKDSETEIELTARGSRLATSVGGTLTGRGGDLIIIDDPPEARRRLFGGQAQCGQRMVQEHLVVPPRRQTHRRDHHRHAARPHG